MNFTSNNYKATKGDSEFPESYEMTEQMEKQIILQVRGGDAVVEYVRELEARYRELKQYSLWLENR